MIWVKSKGSKHSSGDFDRLHQVASSDRLSKSKPKDLMEITQIKIMPLDIFLASKPIPYRQRKIIFPGIAVTHQAIYER